MVSLFMPRPGPIFSMMILADDLPIRGFIGHLEEGSFLPHHHKTFLWTHLHFSFEYNGDQVGITTTWHGIF